MALAALGAGRAVARVPGNGDMFPGKRCDGFRAVQHGGFVVDRPRWLKLVQQPVLTTTGGGGGKHLLYSAVSIADDDRRRGLVFGSEFLPRRLHRLTVPSPAARIQVSYASHQTPVPCQVAGHPGQVCRNLVGLVMKPTSLNVASTHTPHPGGSCALTNPTTRIILWHELTRAPGT